MEREKTIVGRMKKSRKTTVAAVATSSTSCSPMRLPCTTKWPVGSVSLVRKRNQP